MQQLLGEVHDVHPPQSRLLLVLFHLCLNLSALMSERQDSGASGFPLILLTLIITRPLHLSRVGKPHASG
jgi:hypothetical protein